MTKIWLYRVDITKDRNAKIDYISTYLTEHGKTEANAIEVQYQQIALHKNIKLDLAQSQVGKANYNYLEVYQDNKSFYFFIDKATWKSTSTVDFELTLDTVNTFAADFTFNKKTKINRQHKDRFYEIVGIDTSTVPEFSSLIDTYNHKLILNYQWTNEAYDQCLISANNDTSILAMYKYENNKLVQTYSAILYVGFAPDPDTGDYYWVVVDYDGVIWQKSMQEMTDDFYSGIYWVIECINNPEDLTSTTPAWQEIFYGELVFNYIRKVDQVPEGFNPSLFRDSTDIVIDDKTYDSWNLVYQNRHSYDSSDPDAFNQDNIVDCYLYPDKAKSVKLSGAQAYTAASFTTGQWYYWLPTNCTTVAVNGITGEVVKHKHFNEVAGNGDFHCYVNGGYAAECSNGGDNKTQFKFFALNNDGTIVTVYQYVCKANAFGTEISEVQKWEVLVSSNPHFSFSQCRDYSDNHSVVIQLRNDNWAIHLNSKITDTGIVNFLNKYLTAYVLDNSRKVDFFAVNSGTIVQLESINTVDRTDTKILKIINLPYCPLDLNNDIFDGNGWVYDSTNKCLKLDKLTREMETVIYPNYNPLEVLKVNVDFTKVNRNDNLESKIYNSEFYTPKFVYDNFSYQYNLENVNEDNLPERNAITFKITNTINSKMLFDMNLDLKRSNSDYDGLCLIARNNELTLFNSAYLNYIRNGYNYDIKNRNMSIAKSVLTGIAGTVGAGAALGSKGGAAGAAVGIAGGLATTMANVAMTEISADWAINQKLKETELQAVSVSGSDDIDLLRYYTGGNKAKYVIYKCSDRVRQAILDLFYYCGYKDGTYGVPVLTTRRWFNYIECDPVFNEEAATPYKEYLDDIKERYQAGITVYHRVSGSYDFNQVKENWETSLY